MVYASGRSSGRPFAFLFLPDQRVVWGYNKEHMESVAKKPITINVPLVALILTALLIYGIQDGCVVALSFFVLVGELRTFKEEPSFSKWLKGFIIAVTSLVCLALTIKMLIGLYSSLFSA